MVMVRCPLGQSCVLSPSPPPRSLLNGNRKVSHFKIGVKRLSNEVCMCVWVCLLVFLFFAPRSYSFALSFHLHLNEWCSEFKFFTTSITTNSVAMSFIIIYSCSLHCTEWSVHDLTRNSAWLTSILSVTVNGSTILISSFHGRSRMALSQYFTWPCFPSNVVGRLSSGSRTSNGKECSPLGKTGFAPIWPGTGRDSFHSRVKIDSLTPAVYVQ